MLMTPARGRGETYTQMDHGTPRPVSVAEKVSRLPGLLEDPVFKNLESDSRRGRKATSDLYK